MYTGAEQSWVITCCYGGSTVDISNNKSKSRKITNIKLFRELQVFLCYVLYSSLKYYNLTKQNSLVKKGTFIFVIKKDLMLKKPFVYFIFDNLIRMRTDSHIIKFVHTIDYSIFVLNSILKQLLKVNNNYL